jgi:hypothetical protein
MFSITLLQSDDAVTFNEVGIIFPLGPGQTFYDAHIAVDWSVCPPMVGAMSCPWHAAQCCDTQPSAVALRPVLWHSAQCCDHHGPGPAAAHRPPAPPPTPHPSPLLPLLGNIHVRE